MFYMLGLCLYFLFSVKNNMSDEEFSKQYERYIHLITIVLAIVLPTIIVSIGGMNPAPDGNTCMVIDKPFGCNSRDDITCENAGVPYSIGTILSNVLVVAFFVAMIGILSMLYATVRNQERKQEVAFRSSFALPTASTVSGRTTSKSRSAVPTADTRLPISAGRAEKRNESAIDGAGIESLAAASPVPQSGSDLVLDTPRKRRHSQKRLSFSLPNDHEAKESCDGRRIKRSGEISSSSELQSNMSSTGRSSRIIENRSHARSVRSSTRNSYDVDGDRRSQGRMSFSSAWDSLSSFRQSTAGKSPSRYKTKSARAAQRRTRETLIQAICYLALFVATYICPIVSLYFFRSGENTPIVLSVFTNTLYPLSGLLTILVYTRNKVLSLRKRHKKFSRSRAFYIVVMAGADIPPRFRKQRRRSQGSLRMPKRRSSGGHIRRRGSTTDLNSSSVEIVPPYASNRRLRSSKVEEVTSYASHRHLSSTVLEETPPYASNRHLDSSDFEEKPPYATNRHLNSCPFVESQTPTPTPPLEISIDRTAINSYETDEANPNENLSEEITPDELSAEDIHAINRLALVDLAPIVELTSNKMNTEDMTAIKPTVVEAEELSSHEISPDDLEAIGRLAHDIETGDSIEDVSPNVINAKDMDCISITESEELPINLLSAKDLEPINLLSRDIESEGSMKVLSLNNEINAKDTDSMKLSEIDIEESASHEISPEDLEAINRLARDLDPRIR